jgi:hypothetical protein
VSQRRQPPLLAESFSVEHFARHAKALAVNHQVVTHRSSNNCCRGWDKHNFKVQVRARYRLSVLQPCQAGFTSPKSLWIIFVLCQSRKKMKELQLAKDCRAEIQKRLQKRKRAELQKQMQVQWLLESLADLLHKPHHGCVKKCRFSRFNIRI